MNSKNTKHGHNNDCDGDEGNASTNGGTCCKEANAGKTAVSIAQLWQRHALFPS